MDDSFRVSFSQQDAALASSVHAVIRPDRAKLDIIIELDPSAYGTHSMRRTKAALINRKTGNLRAVRLLLGHMKMDSTVRYIGIEIEDALAIAESVDLCGSRLQLISAAAVF